MDYDYDYDDYRGIVGGGEEIGGWASVKNLTLAQRKKQYYAIWKARHGSIKGASAAWKRFQSTIKKDKKKTTKKITKKKVTKKKSTKTKNPYIEFLKKHGGKGWTRKKMLAEYRKHKK
jgi:hypothetical protein